MYMQGTVTVRPTQELDTWCIQIRITVPPDTGVLKEFEVKCAKIDVSVGEEIEVKCSLPQRLGDLPRAVEIYSIIRGKRSRKVFPKFFGR